MGTNVNAGPAASDAEDTEPEAIEGERGIPPVNGRATDGSRKLAKGLAIAGAGLVVMLLAVMYMPGSKSKAQEQAERAQEQKRELRGEAKKSVPTERPTVLKKVADAKAARARAAAATDEDYTVLPRLAAEDLNERDDDETDTRGLPAPRVMRVADAKSKAEVRAEQEAADLAERRLRSPLIAYGGEVREKSGSQGAESDANNAAREESNGIDRATAAIVDALQGGDGKPGNGSVQKAEDKESQRRNVGASESANKGELAQKISPTTVALVSASALPNRDLLITQGTFIDCTLETRIDSTIAGFVRCVTSSNVYSNNGRVVLLERGTKLIGQYQGGVRQGQSRIFVLWTRAETPRGIVINLDSPGTDALGGNGLPGEIDSKFLARFGGALLLSVLNDAFDVLKAEIAEDANFSTNNTQETGKDVANTALESTVNIPPVLYKNQGDKISVTIARDLDFSGVYSLRLTDPVDGAR